jgi:formylglycine-generating enzyme required for sulfatase activity
MAQLLALDNKLVITGGPGSGKSTYLHLVASSIARALTGDAAPIKQALGLRGPLPLPIVVSLGGYNSYRRERKGTLIDYISYAIIDQNAAIGLPDDFFKRLLVRGRSCLLLLDGLDEVARDDDRAIVRQKVEELAYNEGIDRLIVTSRTRAYQGQAVLPFRLAAVQPMSPEQVKALAGKWCAAAYEPDEAARQTRHLWREIEQLEALRAARNQPRLADTPLLVTIIAIVHDNLRKLPEQRAALYEECVKALLSEHHKAPSEEKKALVEWGGTFNEKRNVLAQLAFEMMASADKANPTVREEQFTRWVRPLVVKMRGEEKADGWLADFTEAMRERGSLLDERDREYRFTHLTFQEFLAATYLGDTISEAADIVDRLTSDDRVADSWWRETTLLTAAYVGLRSPDRALRLLNRLATVPAPNEGAAEVALSAAELAGVSFLELDSHDEATRQAIANRLASLLTDEKLTAANPLRAAAGVALGRLGDPREDVSCPVPAMVRIPAGPFVMGSEVWKGRPGYDQYARENEATKKGSRHEVTLPGYAIGKYPVTVAQYRRFVEANGYDLRKSGAYWPGGGLEWFKKSGQRAPVLWDEPRWTVDNHPVVGVTWYEAVAYCAWLSATTGRAFRLPDEAMWEKGARGADGRRWPWGNEFDREKLNSREGGIRRTSAVGIFPGGKSPYEVYDCAGNVWEWCSGAGAGETPYPFVQRPYEEDLKRLPTYRALRGGSWLNYDQNTRAAYRYNDNPDNRSYSVGFRVAELLSDPGF